MTKATRGIVIPRHMELLGKILLMSTRGPGVARKLYNGEIDVLPPNFADHIPTEGATDSLEAYDKWADQVEAEMGRVVLRNSFHNTVKRLQLQEKIHAQQAL